MMINTEPSRRELALLIKMTLNHPCMVPDLAEKIIAALIDVHPMVDQMASAEGIELYLEAFAMRYAMRSTH